MLPVLFFLQFSSLSFMSPLHLFLLLGPCTGPFPPTVPIGLHHKPPCIFSFLQCHASSWLALQPTLPLPLHIPCVYQCPLSTDHALLYWSTNCMWLLKFHMYTTLLQGVRIAQSVYRLDCRLNDLGSIRSRGNDETFSPHCTQTVSGTRTASYPTNT